MSHFTTINSLSLRNSYSETRSLAIKANRNNASSEDLAFADATALRHAIRALEDYDYEGSDKKNESNQKAFSEKIRAFVDVYNNTLESGSEISEDNKYVKTAISRMKKVIESNKDRLKGYGITQDSRGYLSLSDSSVKNVSHDKFEKMLGKNSKVMSTLKSSARRINQHVDVYL